MAISGDSVSVDEQADLKHAADALSSSASTQNLTAMLAPPAGSGSAVSDEERRRWELEKLKLYQQLDDKVKAIMF